MFSFLIYFFPFTLLSFPYLSFHRRTFPSFPSFFTYLLTYLLFLLFLLFFTLLPFCKANVMLVTGHYGKDVLGPIIEEMPFLSWIHTLSAGVETLMIPQIVDNPDITLTNAKGMYSRYILIFILSFFLSLHSCFCMLLRVCVSLFLYFFLFLVNRFIASVCLFEYVKVFIKISN